MVFATQMYKKLSIYQWIFVELIRIKVFRIQKQWGNMFYANI
jgi:hypothetical protein